MRPILPRRTIRQDSHKREQRPDPLLGISVPGFDGTQFGKFTDEIIIPAGTPFEIEVPGIVNDNDDFHQIVSGNGNFTFNVRANSGLVFYLRGGIVKGTSSIFVPRGELVRFRLKVTETETLIGFNETLESGSSLPDSDISILHVGQQTTFGTPSPFEGVIFGFKCWINGDRDTGQIISDISFSRRDCDYQPDRTKPATENVFLPSRVGGNFSDNGDGSYTKSEAGGGDLGEYHLENPISGWYEVEFTVEDCPDSINIFSRDSESDSNRAIATGFGNGSHRAVVKAESGGGIWFAKTAFTGTIRNISIRRCIGCVLQNIIHGDDGNWLDIQKKEWWDHYKGRDDLFIPSFVGTSWDESDDGQYTKIENAWGGLGEHYSSTSAVVPGEYLVSYSMPKEYGNMRLYKRKKTNDGNISTTLMEGVDIEIIVSVESKGLWFDSRDSEGTIISNISFHRLLRIAK